MVKTKTKDFKLAGGTENPRPSVLRLGYDAQVQIAGRPIFTGWFDAVPSRNRKKGWQSEMGKIAEWKFEAKEMVLAARGLTYEDAFFAQCDPMIKERALTVVTVYVRNNGISDITNPDLKPIYDGFTEGGLWPDDEWAWCPLVLYAWGGISDTGQNRIRVDVYNLHSYYVHGEEQALPAGRIRL
jgi:hypothetical protein